MGKEMKRHVGFGLLGTAGAESIHHSWPPFSTRQSSAISTYCEGASNLRGATKCGSDPPPQLDPSEQHSNKLISISPPTYLEVVMSSIQKESEPTLVVGFIYDLTP